MLNGQADVRAVVTGRTRIAAARRPLAGWQPSQPYLTVTVLVAEPPRLLLTVMLCGFVDHVNCPR